MAFFPILFALLAGAANPFQSGTNAELNKQLGQPALTGLWVYISGLLGVLVIALLVRQFSTANLSLATAALPRIPWWAWLGGVLSIGSTLAGLMLVQRLGSGVFTSLSVTASLITSVILDQFGWIGLRQHTASPARLLGCALLVSGVWLVSRF